MLLMVQFDVPNARTQKCYCSVLSVCCRLRFIIFQSECIYCTVRALPRIHTHTAYTGYRHTQQNSCLILIWRIENAFEIHYWQSSFGILGILCNRARIQHTTTCMWQSTQSLYGPRLTVCIVEAS